MKTIEFSCFFSAKVRRATKPSKNIVFSLLFEIVAAVDKEPGEPGEVVDGGTKQ